MEEFSEPCNSLSVIDNLTSDAMNDTKFSRDDNSLIWDDARNSRENADYSISIASGDHMRDAKSFPNYRKNDTFCVLPMASMQNSGFSSPIDDGYANSSTNHDISSFTDEIPSFDCHYYSQTANRDYFSGNSSLRNLYQNQFSDINGMQLSYGNRDRLFSSENPRQLDSSSSLTMCSVQNISSSQMSLSGADDSSFRTSLSNPSYNTQNASIDPVSLSVSAAQRHLLIPTSTISESHGKISQMPSQTVDSTNVQIEKQSNTNIKPLSHTTLSSARNAYDRNPVIFESSDSDTSIHMQPYKPQLLDKSRRFGRRFDFPIPYVFLADSDKRKEFDLEYSRQVSAPNLCVDRNGEANLDMAGYEYTPGTFRYSMPLMYPAVREMQASPILVNSGDDGSRNVEYMGGLGVVSQGGEREQNKVFYQSASMRQTKKQDSRKMPPGENNPDASPGANLCFDYMNKGMCERQRNGSSCRFRHLDAAHPDAIADRFRNGLLSPEDVERYGLRECEPCEVNPFAPIDAKLCFDFLNHKTCSRTNAMKICRFRHLLPNHPDAVADRAKSDNDNPFLPEVVVVDRKEPVQLSPETIRQSSHPVVVFFHICFKVLSVVWYIFCGWISSNTVSNYIITLLLLSFDFYVTKNISGRLLVGLRWWYVVDDRGDYSWSFESTDNTNSSLGGMIDNSVFWLFLLIFPACWVFFSFFCIVKFCILWLCICICGCCLSGLNAYLYTLASRKANQRINLLSYLPDGIKEKAISKFTTSFASAVGSAANNFV